MTLRAYYRDEHGQLTIGTVENQDGTVKATSGEYILPDFATTDLTGWPDTRVYSYDNGRVLVSETELSYMNTATGSVDDRDGWWYEDETGTEVNAVDRGEVVPVVKQGQQWEALS